MKVISLDSWKRKKLVEKALDKINRLMLELKKMAEIERKYDEDKDT